MTSDPWVLTTIRAKMLLPHHSSRFATVQQHAELEQLQYNLLKGGPCRSTLCPQQQSCFSQVHMQHTLSRACHLHMLGALRGIQRHACKGIAADGFHLPC